MIEWLAAMLPALAEAAPAAASAAAPAAAAGAGTAGGGAGAAGLGAMGLNEAMAPLDAMGGSVPGMADPGVGAMMPDAGIAEATVTGQPTEMPMDWTGKLKDGFNALRFASKLVNNKKDKQTLNLLSLGAGLGASGGNLSDPSAQGMVMGPLGEIAAQTQADEMAEQQKLNEAMTPPQMPQMAPPQPAAATPSMQAGMAGMPSPQLTAGMSPEERLRALYGG